VKRGFMVSTRATQASIHRRAKAALELDTQAHLKTKDMLLIEQRLNERIQVLLEGSLLGEDIASRLGITISTVSKWRKRLGIKANPRGGDFVSNN
jgi:DNA-binding MarR family transcriptional regulator